MNYQQTIDFLYSRLPLFSRIGPPAIKPDLTNTIALCKAVGDPHKRFKSVHVAGTNGKGSTSHMLASVFQTAGYKTGLYTSPHLHDFRERIKIDGEMIPQQYVIDFTQRITPMIDSVEPSFFEVTVALAFEYFAAEKVDIAIIEVGLGGRLDSTNIITPELSIITNIGWDHMNILGNTLAAIASEKGGIIKKGIPVVIGEVNSETEKVFVDIAEKNNSLLTIANQERYVSDWHYQKHQLSATVASNHHDERDSFVLDLPGYYQTKNLLTVIEAIHQLNRKGWKISKRDLKEGLSVTKKLTGLHGRWETIHEHPEIVLDVAHNEDGMKQLLSQLELSDHHQLHIVIGLVKDKEIEKVLALLPKEASYYFTKASIPRALPEGRLQEIAAKFGLRGNHFETVDKAVQSAKQHASSKDLILICGSVFVVAEVSR
ncbi:MAG: bifunctional folylpolyglutamate synthase/dihydrofolate synthase [Chitinophagaceae bacterium]|nr:bifunctional folylpolyglutamate synthase/dihydrofolate synthase [Chitinophagaceae bacterium]